MARTESEIVVAASAAEVMEVIADFPAYPQWATGMRQAEVLHVGDDGRATDVHFHLDAPPIRDEFTLRYRWDGDRGVSWNLAEKASMLTAMNGAYLLRQVDGGTQVRYQLEVDVKVPLLGMLKRKAEKVIIDTALRGLKRRVESTP